MSRLRAKRHPQKRIFATGGLLIRPPFLDPLPDDLGAARAEIGLEPDRATIVMTYGGHGGPRMVELADALAAADAQLQLPYPHLVLGYCDDIHRYLALADLFVGKARPQSVSEALVLGLPLLIDERRVLPQERALTRWVKASGVGTTFSRPSQFLREVQALVARPRSRSAREAARCNTAAEDIVRIIAELLTWR